MFLYPKFGVKWLLNVPFFGLKRFNPPSSVAIQIFPFGASQNWLITFPERPFLVPLETYHSMSECLGDR